jgi:hypothetical protein
LRYFGFYYVYGYYCCCDSYYYYACFGYHGYSISAVVVVLLLPHQFMFVPYCYYQLHKIKQYIVCVHMRLYHNPFSNLQVETFGGMDRGAAMSISVYVLFLHVVQRMLMFLRYMLRGISVPVLFDIEGGGSICLWIPCNIAHIHMV